MEREVDGERRSAGLYRSFQLWKMGLGAAFGRCGVSRVVERGCEAGIAWFMMLCSRLVLGEAGWGGRLCNTVDGCGRKVYRERFIVP